MSCPDVLPPLGWCLHKYLVQCQRRLNKHTSLKASQPPERNANALIKVVIYQS